MKHKKRDNGQPAKWRRRPCSSAFSPAFPHPLPAPASARSRQVGKCQPQCTYRLPAARTRWREMAISTVTSSRVRGSLRDRVRLSFWSPPSKMYPGGDGRENRGRRRGGRPQYMMTPHKAAIPWRTLLHLPDIPLPALSIFKLPQCTVVPPVKHTGRRRREARPAQAVTAPPEALPLPPVPDNDPAGAPAAATAAAAASAATAAAAAATAAGGGGPPSRRGRELTGGDSVGEGGGEEGGGGASTNATVVILVGTEGLLADLGGSLPNGSPVVSSPSPSSASVVAP